MLSAKHFMHAYLVCPNQEPTPVNDPAFAWHAQIIATMIMNWLSCIQSGNSAAIVVHRKFWRFAVNWIPIKWRIMMTTRIIRTSLECIALAIAHIRIQTNRKRQWFNVLCARTGTIQSKSRNILRMSPLYLPCIWFESCFYECPSWMQSLQLSLGLSQFI